MPRGFPFHEQVAGSDRSYYEPAMRNRPPQNPIWSGGRQSLVHPEDEQLASAAKFGVGVAGLMAAGFIRMPGGNVMNQVYIPFFRAVEEYSPNRMLRTFRISEYMGRFDRAMRGGHKIRDVWKMSTDYAAYLMERFNKLSREIPFGFPGGQKIQDWLVRRGVPEWMTHMGVKRGRALPTFGRILGKYGAVTAGLYFGYGTADHYLEEWLGKGPTELAADLYTGTKKGLAHVAGMTGAREYAKRQEEIAPGSTDILKLAAFPMMGILSTSLAHYARTVGSTAQIQWRGRDVQRARRVADYILGRYGRAYPKWFNKIGRFAKENKVLGKILKIDRPSRLIGLMGGLAGAAMIAPFVPGALIPQKTPEELEAIYTGEQLVPIRKGRYWEFGRTPWEGGRISYYRPHAIALMRSEARDVAVHGEKMSPIEKFIKANFTYEFERKNYEDRPYPITGAAFEDVPFVGPLLAGTIGKLIKPPKLMHTEEWMRKRAGTSSEQVRSFLSTQNELEAMGAFGEPGTEYKHMPLSFGGHRALELGEKKPGAPIDPYGAKGTFSEQWYRMTEMLGLPGFMTEVIKERVTGEGQWFTQEQRLESARRAYGSERKVWDLELGGGFHIGEVARRLFPHRQRAVPLYNPIRNTMPEWLPGPGARSRDFLHGDPYTKVKMGELRLPGKGYEVLHPELKDTDPEDYPLIHRYKILADVAPYSEKFKEHLDAVREAKKADELTDKELAIYKETERQRKSRRARKEFDEYRYDSTESLAEYNEELARKGSEPVGTFGQFVGRYWEMLAHGAETPLEYLTPVSPASKLIHMRTAIEDYERTQLYGTQNAFWQHPVKHFLKPFTRASARMFGYSGIPEDIQEVRDIESYFDILKWVKFKRLKRMAAAEQDWEAAKEFRGRARETLFGINPYTYDYTHLYRSLPSRERDYFQSFENAESKEKREKILEMVPENQRGLYMARWQRNRLEEIKKKLKKEDLAEDKRKELENELNNIYNKIRYEGKPTSNKLWVEFQKERMKGESYADWFRRDKELHEELEGMSLPGPDWIGWHPGVDLNDVKLKLIQNMGRDMHDFNLWPSDARKLAHKPFINDKTIEEITEGEDLSYEELQARITKLLQQRGMEDVQVNVSMHKGAAESKYDVRLDIREDRLADAQKAFFRGV